MMFKGSTKYTWEDVNRIFDEIGARYNAFTTQEMTAYYANVLPEFTEKAIEHLSHLLRPAIRNEDFDTEKKVILEEIAMYLDQPGEPGQPPRAGGSVATPPHAPARPDGGPRPPAVRPRQHGPVRDRTAGLRRDRETRREVHGQLAARGR